MSAPGNSALIFSLLALFVACSGYAAGRIHQRNRTDEDREEAYRHGYDTATRSVFTLAARIIAPRRAAARGSAKVKNVLGEATTKSLQALGSRSAPKPPATAGSAAAPGLIPSAGSTAAPGSIASAGSAAAPGSIASAGSAAAPGSIASAGSAAAPGSIASAEGISASGPVSSRAFLADLRSAAQSSAAPRGASAALDPAAALDPVALEPAVASDRAGLSDPLAGDASRGVSRLSVAGFGTRGSDAAGSSVSWSNTGLGAADPGAAVGSGVAWLGAVDSSAAGSGDSAPGAARPGPSPTASRPAGFGELGFPVPPPPAPNTVAEPAAVGGVTFQPFPDPRPADGIGPFPSFADDLPDLAHRPSRPPTRTASEAHRPVPSPRAETAGDNLPGERPATLHLADTRPPGSNNAPSESRRAAAERSAGHRATDTEANPAPVPDADPADSPGGRHTVPDELVQAATYRLPPDRVFRAKVRDTTKPDTTPEDPTARRPVPKPRQS